MAVTSVMGRGAVVLTAIAGAAVWYAAAGEDARVVACLDEARLIDTAYRGDPPRADSHRAFESILGNARAWCGEKKLREANSALEMAALLCVANKGCRGLREEVQGERLSAR